MPTPIAALGITCSACGGTVDTAPEATSIHPHGAYALVAEWRICACGAFVRSERVRRLDRDDDVLQIVSN